MEKILLILGAIITVVVVFFFLGILIATKVSNAKSKKRLKEIYESSPFREKKKKPSGEDEDSDEFQARDERKEIVTGKAVSKAYERFRRKEEELEDGLVAPEKEKNFPSQDTVIVKIAKPVGFWSRLIMSQKLGFLMALRQQMNKNNKHGYFVNLINAQARSQSKEKGRGL
jgi:hypothetical protein